MTVRASALLLAVLALPAQAEIFDVNVGSEAFRVAVNGPLSRLLSNVNGQYDFGTVVRPENDEDLFTAFGGALVTGDAGARGIDVAAGLGARLQYTGRERDSGGGVALGGQLEARIPQYERVGFQTYAYFQPEVISLGDVEEQKEFAANVDYQVLRDGSIYLGYRVLKVDIENLGEVTADDGLHFGLRLKF
ncbi:MAG TPA: YfaZ family outer membrane protein [Nevskiaceae bacterium]|nr:YfaZ family outer membrane protein [Nevskiaceae bacterium]